MSRNQNLFKMAKKRTLNKQRKAAIDMSAFVSTFIRLKSRFFKLTENVSVIQTIIDNCTDLGNNVSL